MANAGSSPTFRLSSTRDLHEEQQEEVQGVWDVEGALLRKTIHNSSSCNTLANEHSQLMTCEAIHPAFYLHISMQNGQYIEPYTLRAYGMIPPRIGMMKRRVTTTPTNIL